MPCTEDTALVLQDGTKKIVINAEAFRKAENPDLEDFLEYLKTGKAKSIFTQEIEAMIQTIKNNEQARQEYRLLSTFEMDAIDRGIQQGIAKGKSLGLAEGKSLGLAEGVRKTAAALKQMGLAVSQIVQATGLSAAEIEVL